MNLLLLAHRCQLLVGFVYVRNRLETILYVGAEGLKERTKRTTFIRVQEQENNVYSKE
ncbi:hypothetical protein L3V77_17440 [Vibrio sp. DW001]|uniref:hypothetical protein n=1 Tax=Vibrio sp. DW001 TaxID=2912315 RepID=UPI0023B09DDA|nr:hypothetical protein [Vibrio sp. DW001]WED29215.1 hypothetical protein L3V77_17440 [Vibrio sp. DW001]